MIEVIVVYQPFYYCASMDPAVFVCIWRQFRIHIPVLLLPAKNRYQPLHWRLPHMCSIIVKSYPSPTTNTSALNIYLSIRNTLSCWNNSSKWGTEKGSAIVWLKSVYTKTRTHKHKWFLITFFSENTQYRGMDIIMLLKAYSNTRI